MAQIREILVNKGTHLVTVAPSASVFEAAVLMNEHRIGALVVVQNGELVGMFTERDLLQRVVGEERNPRETAVGAVMTTEVACCQLNTTIDEARSVMKNRRIRHLPVLDTEERLLGLISIGDLNAYQANTQEMTIHLLHQYIYGG